jgi:nucleotide-binding universal stress UspA family protein
MLIELGCKDALTQLRRIPKAMKVLLLIDGSEGSRAALEEAIARPWPAQTEVRVVSVAHTYIPIVANAAFTLAAARHDLLEQDRKRALQDVDEAAKAVSASASKLTVTSAALEGEPKEIILEEAERWSADLIIMGSHGHGAVRRFFLGSVAQAVVVHAACSVEVVRRRETPAAKA